MWTGAVMETGDEFWSMGAALFASMGMGGAVWKEAIGEWPVSVQYSDDASAC